MPTQKNSPHVVHCCSPEETIAVGKALGKNLQKNAVVCLEGDLGAGKTTFTKGLVQGLAGLPPEEVSSPTFTYLNIYEGRQTLYHFDLYRLSDEEDFLNMGFDEYFYAGGACCIEWSERIAPLLPQDAIHVFLEHKHGEGRTITIRGDYVIY